MKAKKLVKNLVFKKETIANLSIQEMKIAHGGDWTVTSCTNSIYCGVTSMDVCSPTMCATACGWTEGFFCTIAGCNES